MSQQVIFRLVFKITEAYLNVAWNLLEDIIDLILEASSEHFIGFVEDKEL